MVDPKYQHIGSPEIKLIEELSEMIKCISKGDRFGWFNHHPNREETNFEALIREWNDVKIRYNELMNNISNSDSVKL